MLTASEAKKHVAYDPDTGLFTRITSCKYHARNNGKVITTTDSVGYVVFKIGDKMYKGHRIAWLITHGKFPSGYLDHINQVRNDNRICNLREATPKQNNENKRLQKNNKSGVVGVVWYPYGKWRATICHNKENLYLGEYETFEEAAKARAQAVKKLFTHAKVPPAST